jgi:hypothetical protein
MWQSYRSGGKVACVKRLLQDPRIRATIDFKDGDGHTALRDACTRDSDKEETPAMARRPLQAGANPFLTNKQGLTPLALLQQQWRSYHSTIALLEEAQDAEKARLLVKGRSLVTISTSNVVAPSYLQKRVAQGQTFPHVVLMPVTGSNKLAKRPRKLRTLLAFVLGMEGGPEGEGMSRDVFRVVLNGTRCGAVS